MVRKCLAARWFGTRVDYIGCVAEQSEDCMLDLLVIHNWRYR
ncbi:hypothetical protein VCR31J2_1270353 [Vibrio coralliirubri]|uniref:Uncharacterized protein n=1 Tax=Vibrio coralliirubri TaxID=1516159 RepID=A0AA86X9D1_9VIBR|nr:hypothetical protein VCR4J2_580043 [Vibrio coralliirubri]CDT58857.1 hypothetical protein VCR31J2_1270353 [Vibrio coralliirubri]